MRSMQIPAFRAWLKARGLVATTANNYVSAVQRALVAMGAVEDAPDLGVRLLDASALAAYQDQLDATQRNVLRVAWAQFRTWAASVELPVAGLLPTPNQRRGGRGRPPSARQLDMDPAVVALLRALGVLGLTPKQISQLTWEHVTPGAPIPTLDGAVINSYQITVPPRVLGLVRADVVDAARACCVAVAPALPVIQRSAACADPITASEIAALLR